MDIQQEKQQLYEKFQRCQKLLTAFGDEMRQEMLLLMVAGDRSGMRVADIAHQTRLSRPAVSHHMQILKDSGVVKCRKEGKYIYYYLDSGGGNVDAILELFTQVKRIMQDGEKRD